MSDEKNNNLENSDLSEFERRMRVIIERQLADAEDMKNLQQEITSAGFSHRALKRVVKAIIASDNGNEKPLKALREDVSDASLYLDRLAPEQQQAEDAA